MEKEYKARISRINSDLDSLTGLLQSNKDTIIKIVTIQDTIIKEKAIYISIASGEVDKAKSVSEEEADSLLNDRFDTRKNNWVFVKQADSITIDLNYTKKLYLLEQKKSFSLTKSVDMQANIIKKKDKLTGINEMLFKSELSAEKKKKFRAFGFGVVVGVGVVGVLILVK